MEESRPKSRAAWRPLASWLAAIALAGGFGMLAMPAGAHQAKAKTQTGGNLPIDPIGIAPGIFVQKNGVMAVPAGEVQTTVIPPGKKLQCPKGRLLVSNDGVGNAGQIAYVDLDRIYDPPKYASMAPLPSSNYSVKSNDHDLITLRNGDLLFIRMGRSIQSLSPKPSWFDWTYKISKEGVPDLSTKGSRSCVMVWRSTDGGEHFDFLSTIDTGKIDDDFGTKTDGSGGFPQHPKTEQSPGTAQQPLWQMGGTDGILSREDPATGRVFVVIGAVGYVPQSDSPFSLSSNPLPRTHVAVSSDRGATWQKAGNLNFRGWRTEVVPRGNDVLSFAAFGWNDPEKEGHTIIDHGKISAFADPNVGHLTACPPEVQGTWGWSRYPYEFPLLKKSGSGLTHAMTTHVPSQSVLMRSPSSQNVVLATANMIEGNGGGYHLWLQKPSNQWVRLPDIAPTRVHPDSFILHLTVIDPGSGPLLLYWYDVDAVAKTATIRGRILTGDEEWTSDFPISLNGVAARSFSVSPPRWYGDYHTAAGFKAPDRRGQLTTYEFLPVWVEPDSKTHFARIQYRVAATPKRLDRGPLMVKFLGPVPKDRITYSRKIDPRKLKFANAEEEAK